MASFLIQASGREITASSHMAAGGKGPTFADDPIEHYRYVNGGDSWKRGAERKRSWEQAEPGDAVILYTMGSVDEYPSCLSFIFKIGEKTIDEDGARLDFDSRAEVFSPIDLEGIDQLIEEGVFTEEMRQCGTRGFNIQRISDKNVENLYQMSAEDAFSGLHSNSDV